MKKTTFLTLIPTFTLAPVSVFTFAFVLALSAVLFICGCSKKESTLPEPPAINAFTFLDSADFVKVDDFSYYGYSTEGGEMTLFINTKTRDSIVTEVDYGETGRWETIYVFNKELITAEYIISHYDGQIAYETGRREVASTERISLKTSPEDAEKLTSGFLITREELTKRAPIRQGFAYLDQGDNERAPSYYDLAVEEFNRAMRLDSLSADAYHGRGRAYLRKGDNKRAVADFSMAIRLNPTNAISLSNRGRAYARLGDYDKAVADFEAAAKFAPGNELIQQNLERAKRREKGL